MSMNKIMYFKSSCIFNEFLLSFKKYDIIIIWEIRVSIVNVYLMDGGDFFFVLFVVVFCLFVCLFFVFFFFFVFLFFVFFFCFFF